MILFVNARVFDGSGAAPFTGEVLIKENRIAAVAPPGARRCHATMSWWWTAPAPRSCREHRVSCPLKLAEFGGTICSRHELASRRSAAKHRPQRTNPARSRIHQCVLRGSIGKNSRSVAQGANRFGRHARPRLLPSSIEREPPNETAYLQGGSVAEHGKGPDAVRAFIKDCAASGARIVKFLLSGESALKPGASLQTSVYARRKFARQASRRANPTSG